MWKLHNYLRVSVVSVNFLIKSFLVCLLLIGFSFGVVHSWGGGVVSVEVAPIAWFSAVWFVFVLVVGSVSERVYWSLVPFLILFTPNVINDFFPSAPMASGAEAPLFSFITHIDVYFFLGVFLYCDFSRKQPVVRTLSVLLFFLFFFFVCWGAVGSGRGWMVALGDFQLRYVFLLLLLFMYSNPLRYEKHLSRSFMIAVLLVVLEAWVFSFLHGQDRLTSGNYGVNTLGHLMAAGAIFCLSRQVPSSVEKVSCVAMAMILVASAVATGTRFSLVALVVAISLTIFIQRGRLSWLLLGSVIATLFITLFFVFVPAGISMWEGLALVSQDLSDPSNIQITPESSSMVTRLTLWWGTLAMIADHPWLGVGPGSWTFLKMQYGIMYEGVLDPHQDFLNYIVSYGWLFGVVFFLIVFVAPVVKVYRYKGGGGGAVLLPWLSLILVFLISGMSNAVTWKHQVGALTYFAAFLILFWRSEYGKARV